MAETRRIKARRIATEFVSAVNAITHCANCGKQPIEWHRKEHEEHPNWRISSLRVQGNTIARIKREMELCVPYCRSCHMEMDGRKKELQISKPNQKGISHPLKPCYECGKLYKPLRKGMCSGCYNNATGLRPRKTPIRCIYCGTTPCNCDG